MSAVRARPGIRAPAGTPRPATISGIAQRRLVDEEAVRRLPVVAQRLAVIGEHRHHEIGRPRAARAASISRPTQASA